MRVSKGDVQLMCVSKGDIYLMRACKDNVHLICVSEEDAHLMCTSRQDAHLMHRAGWSPGLCSLRWTHSLQMACDSAQCIVKACPIATRLIKESYKSFRISSDMGIIKNYSANILSAGSMSEFPKDPQNSMLDLYIHVLVQCQYFMSSHNSFAY